MGISDEWREAGTGEGTVLYSLERRAVERRGEEFLVAVDI